MRHEVLTLAVPTSVASGAAQNVKHLESASVQFHGTGTLTFKLQGKISDGAGADSHDEWTDLEVAAATSRVVAIPQGITHVRVNVTAFTSGTFSAHIGGKNSRTD